jgi:hypothetical protein
MFWNLTIRETMSTPHTKFLGLITDDSLSWKAHIDQMKYSVFCNPNVTSYNVYWNFKNGLFCIRTFNYELQNNFWENQPYNEKIFKIQKRVIRIITNSRMRDSCRKLFQRFEILPLYSHYIFSLSIFVIKDKHLYNTNNQIHSVHTRFKTNLHPPIANLTKFQRAVYYSGIKVFNNLPYDIKNLANEITLFRNALKRFLLWTCSWWSVPDNVHQLHIIVKNILIIRDNLENWYQIESTLLPLDI